MMSLRFQDKRATVMGLGSFGGGAGVTRWLADQGARITVTDLRPAAQLADSIGAIADLVESGIVALRLGEHRTVDFRDADLVVANPAVPRPWENQFLNAARHAGVAVTTEIRLLVERLNRERIIAVTGSAGKSTTAAMIHHALTASGSPSRLGGNLGGSLLPTLDEITADDWIVLELSSSMLHWLAGWSPHIAVLTNLEPNHLDWHGDFEHYRNCKEQIFRDQLPGDQAVRGDDVPMPDESLPLLIPGRHNQHNAAMALRAVSLALCASESELAPLLSDFPGLPHRLQCISEFDGCRAFNDSKSTTPRATVLAVESFDEQSHVHLIAGGYDKGSDLSPIANLAGELAGLYTIGATGAALARAAHIHAADARVVACNTLERAVSTALQNMQEGDVLLLSPGCASWDQFANYEERGQRFAELVKNAAYVDTLNPR